MRIFDTKAPWKDLRTMRPGRLGVGALVDVLSPLLMRKLIAA